MFDSDFMKYLITFFLYLKIFVIQILEKLEWFF